MDKLREICDKIILNQLEEYIPDDSESLRIWDDFFRQILDSISRVAHDLMTSFENSPVIWDMPDTIYVEYSTWFDRGSYWEPSEGGTIINEISVKTHKVTMFLTENNEGECAVIVNNEECGLGRTPEEAILDFFDLLLSENVEYKGIETNDLY